MLHGVSYKGQVVILCTNSKTIHTRPHATPLLRWSPVIVLAQTITFVTFCLQHFPCELPIQLGTLKCNTRNRGSSSYVHTFGYHSQSGAKILKDASQSLNKIAH